ncbi:hypothetical protein [Kineococcus terrestris]|uniref:hypothetical protein n=1 Tax=Kineococcus terrestris TaxID=2044856 RepID=UPI0034DAF872
MRNVLCRLGRHRWTEERTEDGETCLVCSRCHRDGPGAWDVSSVRGSGEAFRWGQGGPTGFGTGM